MKLKVVISAIHYPLTMARWFIEAFDRRDDIDLKLVGPFTGNRIPWGGGMSIPMQYVRTPDVPLPEQVIGTSPSSRVAEAQLPWTPDLWLQIDAGFHFSNKPTAGIVAHIGTDPHVLSNYYTTAKAYSDVVFCMQTPYIQNGEYFLPYAADPLWHAPLDLPKKYDVCLIGLHYEQRTRLVNRLRAQGLKVYYDLGPVFREYQELYSSSKVALSWSSLADTPARVYEGMCLGCGLVANRTKDLVEQFVEGDHFLGFGGEVEAQMQIERLLADDAGREEMGFMAHRKVMAQHLWDHRVAAILDRCGFLH